MKNNGQYLSKEERKAWLEIFKIDLYIFLTILIGYVLMGLVFGYWNVI